MNRFILACGASVLAGHGRFRAGPRAGAPAGAEGVLHRAAERRHRARTR